MLLRIHLMLFLLRAMKTSIDSLKLAVSWKGSQIPGAKFTVKVCVHSVLRWEGVKHSLCYFYLLQHFSTPLSFAREVDFTLCQPAFELNTNHFYPC